MRNPAAAVLVAADIPWRFVFVTEDKLSQPLENASRLLLDERSSKAGKTGRSLKVRMTRTSLAGNRHRLGEEIGQTRRRSTLLVVILKNITPKNVSKNTRNEAPTANKTTRNQIRDLEARYNNLDKTVFHAAHASSQKHWRCAPLEITKSTRSFFQVVHSTSQ